MFRSILLQARKSLHFAVTQSGNNLCNGPARRTKSDLNEVNLVGWLLHKPYVMVSGYTELDVKTLDQGRGYLNHKIRTHGFEDLTPGCRVDVTGRLTSVPFVADKKRNRAVVWSNELYVIDDADKNNDRNILKIVGNVATDIAIKDNHCIFTIASHYNPPTIDGYESHRNTNHFHTVCVHNAHARNSAKAVEKGDRVILEGKLGYRMYITEEGKKVSSGFIVPDRISKIARKNTNDKENI